MSSYERNLRRLLLAAIREHAVDEQLQPATRESAVVPREGGPDSSSGSDRDMLKRLQLRRALKRNGDGEGETPRRPMFATVCINNVNRSMEAHCVLQDAGLRVCSFGAGVQVCFPGRKIDTPRLFGFGTEYKTMYNTLRAEDEELYRIIGVLKMLERNMQVKPKPQQFQLLLNKQLLDLDVIVCLDYSMFIQVLNDLRMRIRFSFHKKRLHVICLDVEDTPQDALNGGALTLELCQEIDALPELNDASVKKTVVAFEKRHQLELFYVGLSV